LSPQTSLSLLRYLFKYSIFLPSLISCILGCLLDDERAKLYADVVKKGYAARFAFAASVFGETSEALFWLQLPQAIRHLMNKLTRRSPQKISSPTLDSGADEVAMPSKIPSTGLSSPEARKIDSMVSFKIIFFFLSKDHAF